MALTAAERQLAITIAQQGWSKMRSRLQGTGAALTSHRCMVTEAVYQDSIFAAFSEVAELINLTKEKETDKVSA